VNATCDLDAAALLAYLLDGGPPPPPVDVVQYALGALAGLPLGFTDAVALAGGAVAFTAAAEDSPDAVADGAVGGSVVGVVDAGGAARWTPLVGPDGAPLVEKAEGIAVAPPVDPSPDGARLWVVTDADDPERPAELCEVQLRGTSPRGTGPRAAGRAR
jgi:hypothetical protein